MGLDVEAFIGASTRQVGALAALSVKNLVELALLLCTSRDTRFRAEFDPFMYLSLTSCAQFRPLLHFRLHTIRRQGSAMDTM